MKFVTKHVIAQALFCILCITSTYARVVEFTEDPYLTMAPKNMVDLVEKTAQLMDFNGAYEVVVPKKSGMHINPWNRLISHGTNPQTNNPLIIINPEWFWSIPQEQQTFLLGRCFLSFQYTGLPLTLTFFPILFGLFSLFFIFLLIWGFGKTRIAHYKMFFKILIALSISTICNIVIINPLQVKLRSYLGFRYDTKIHERVIQKTTNKDAAIKALELINTAINQEIKNGETFWTPYASLFKNYANTLKNFH